jgi:microcystin-dependent protein
MSIRKPGIPVVQTQDRTMDLALAAVKENLEIITGARPQLRELVGLSNTASFVDLVNKVNEIIGRLNFSGTSQSPFSQLAITTTSIAGAFIPSGSITLWSGATSALPVGWVLCDGTNGAPDLRGRFIIGAGSTYAVGATGGSADAVVVAHSHTITDPGHAHDLALGETDGSGSYVDTATNSLTVESTSSSFTGITIDSEGVSGVGANLPPYYALAYIMKL